MNQEISKIAQEMCQHAQIGPAGAGQIGKVRNTLSPHLERLYYELIRMYVIKATQQTQAAVIAELILLKNLMPEDSQAQVDLTASRINAILQTVYK